MSDMPITTAESTSSWMWRRWRPTLLTAAIGIAIIALAIGLPADPVGRFKLWIGIAGVAVLLLLPTIHMRPLYKLYAQVGSRIGGEGLVEIARVEFDRGDNRFVSRGYAIIAATEEMLEVHTLTDSQVVRIPAESLRTIRSLLGFFRGRIRIGFETTPGRREQLLIDPVVKVVTASAGKGNVEVLGERLRDMWGLPDPRAPKAAEQPAE